MNEDNKYLEIMPNCVRSICSDAMLYFSSESAPLRKELLITNISKLKEEISKLEERLK